MSRIVIISDARLSAPWAETLRRDQHDVTAFDDGAALRSLFDEETFDIVIVDIDKPDGGHSMLMPQVRAAWPDCKIVAVVADFEFRRSAVYAMGLWTPDQVLIKPVVLRLLRATAAFLSAQIRSKEIRTHMAGDLANARKQVSTLSARRQDEVEDASRHPLNH